MRRALAVFYVVVGLLTCAIFALAWFAPEAIQLLVMRGE